MGARQKRLWIRFGAFAGVVLIASMSGVLVREWSVGNFLELKSYDYRFAFRDRRNPQDVPITILAVDEPSLQKNPAPLMLWHRQFGEAIDGLVRGGAGVIGIDFVFSDISMFDAEGQRKLSESILTAGTAEVPLVLGYRLLDRGIEEPPDFIRMAALALGHSFAYLNLTTDNDDFIRRQEIRSRGDRPEPGFALALANAFLAQRSKPPVGDDTEKVLLINYREPRHFPIESFHRVLEAGKKSDETYLKKTFGGRIVLIARIGERGDEDLHPTPHYYWRSGMPAGSSRRTPGIEIHANTITTLLSDGPIRRQSTRQQNLVNIACAFLAALTSMVLRPFRAGLATAAILLAVGYYAFAGSFARNEWMDIVAPMTAGIVSIGLAQSANFVLEGQERRRIRNAFGRYVNDKVIDKILHDSDQVTLNGKRMPVAVLFADVKGFTTRSERSSAEDVVRMLNEYFTGVIDAIQNHSGMVNTLMGDGLMALFGAPLEDPQAASNAIKAAREMLKTLERVNERLKEQHLEPIEIGIGIHYGEAIVGNMGSPRKMEFTAIGDVVNTAARIEGLTRKIEKADICITGELYEAAGKPADAEYAGEFEVKGRASRVPIYKFRL